MTEPSGCWKVSRIAATIRARARPGAVEGVDELGLGARLGPVADGHPAGLVVPEVRARADLEPALDARRPDLEVVLAGLDEAHVAGRHEQHPVGQAQALEEVLGAAGHPFERGRRRPRAARRGPSRPCRTGGPAGCRGCPCRRPRPRAGSRASRRRSGSAARSASKISSRWRLVTGTSAVGTRYSSSRGDDVHLVFLVRDLAGAPGRGGVDHGRRPDLGDAVLAGVDVEEEVDQRALEAPSPGPRRRGSPSRRSSPRARDRRSPGRLADLPVRPALPARPVRRRIAPTSPLGWTRQLLAPRPDGHVGLFATDRDVGVGRVGDAQEQVLDRRLDRRPARRRSRRSGCRPPSRRRAGRRPRGRSARRRRGSPRRSPSRRRCARPSAGRPRPAARGAGRRRPGPRRRAPGPRPCRSRPGGSAAGSSRRRCSPTLIAARLPGRSRRPPRAAAPRRRPARGWPAASRPAARSAGPGRRGRSRRRPGRGPGRPAVAVEKISACQASPEAGAVHRRRSLPRRGAPGRRAAPGRARRPRPAGRRGGPRSGPAPGRRSPARRRAAAIRSSQDRRLGGGQRRALLGLDPGLDVDARDLAQQRQVAEGGPEGGGHGRDVGGRVEERIAEDALVVARQLALHRRGRRWRRRSGRTRRRGAGSRRCRRGRTRSPGLRPRAQEEEPQLLRRHDLGDLVGRRRRGPWRSTSCGRRCSGTRRAR